MKNLLLITALLSTVAYTNDTNNTIKNYNNMIVKNPCITFSTTAGLVYTLKSFNSANKVYSLLSGLSVGVGSFLTCSLVTRNMKFPFHLIKKDF